RPTPRRPARERPSRRTGHVYSIYSFPPSIRRAIPLKCCNVQRETEGEGYKPCVGVKQIPDGGVDHLAARGGRSPQKAGNYGQDRHNKHNECTPIDSAAIG